MAKISKRKQLFNEKVNKEQNYDLKEAISLLKEVSQTKFDQTVEVAFKMNLDPTKADQQLRGALVLPHGTGKTAKILVFAEGDAAKAAQEAGADYVGSDDLVEKIQKENWFDFDVVVATPDMMGVVGRLGRVLGPKGLMPNPKTGTVTTTPAKTVNDIKKGMVEYRTDSYGNIHTIIGKASFTEEQLLQNYMTLADTLVKVKPAGAKGQYMRTITMSCTMGPGVKVDVLKANSDK